MRKLIKFLFGVLALVFAINFVVILPDIDWSYIGPIIGLHLLAALLWFLWFSFWMEPKKYRKREIKSHGFYVEFISPSVLRGLENQFAVVYYEGNQETEVQIWFYGTQTNERKLVLLVPSLEDWNEKVPDWAKNRRIEIIKRVQQTDSMERYSWEVMSK